MKRLGWIAVRVVPVLLILLGLFLIGCTQGLFGSGQGATTPIRLPAAPPWFTADSSCQFTETSAQSRGDPHSFDSAGKSTGLLPQGQVTCVLEIQVCADMIFKSKVVNTAAHEPCPDNLHYSRAPKPKCVAPNGTSPSAPKAPAIR